jgi:hypothetical protein
LGLELSGTGGGGGGRDPSELSGIGGRRREEEEKKGEEEKSSNPKLNALGKIKSNALQLAKGIWKQCALQ